MGAQRVKTSKRKLATTERTLGASKLNCWQTFIVAAHVL
jgi:hypothetical protein